MDCSKSDGDIVVKIPLEPIVLNADEKKKIVFFSCLIDQATIQDYVCTILARNSKYFGRYTEIQSVTYITKSKARFLKTMFLHFAGKIPKKVLNQFS